MASLVDFQRHNRPHRPTDAHLDLIYKIYTTLFRSEEATKQLKQIVLESAAVCLYPLRVVCISEDALRKILVNRSARTLRRGHPVSRASRAADLFGNKRKVSKEKFAVDFFENDTVELVTSVENNRDGVDHGSSIFPVPEGRFGGVHFRFA